MSSIFSYFRQQTPQIISPAMLESGPSSSIHEDREVFEIRPLNYCEKKAKQIRQFYIMFNKFSYNHTSPLARNLSRVAFAGGMSFLGGIISGDPRITAVLGGATISLYIGSATGGLGNALSTWLAWETPIDKKVEKLEEENHNLKDIVTKLGEENYNLKGRVTKLEIHLGIQAE